jgi:hypothetical protein
MSYGTKGLYSIATKAVNGVARKEVTGAASSVLGSAHALPVAFVVGSEIMMVCRDIKNAADQRRNGHITRNEFIKISIKRAGEGAGSLSGVAIALAIPLTCNCIGITLGALIGQGVGSFVGRQICVAAD